MPLRLFALLAVSLCLAACGGSKKEPSGPADATYTSRGLVSSVTAATDSALSRLGIHHERIENFMSREGKKVGMDSMDMQFDVKQGVNLDGVATGKKLSFEFEVRWTGSPTLLLTKAQVLPAGTAMDLNTGDDHDDHGHDHDDHGHDDHGH